MLDRGFLQTRGCCGVSLILGVSWLASVAVVATTFEPAMIVPFFPWRWMC
ncbi:hypothetical protein Hanom_Chr06g00492131 [Helianthus anomalus]